MAMNKEKFTQEQKARDEAFKKEWAKFEEIIYSQLEKVLEKRPNYPVTAFAKGILEEIGLDEHGDPIKKKKGDKKKRREKGEAKESAPPKEEAKAKRRAPEESKEKKKNDVRPERKKTVDEPKETTSKRKNEPS